MKVWLYGGYMRLLSVLLLAFSLLVGVAVAEPDDVPGEAIGEVLGKKIYRNEIFVPEEYRNIVAASTTVRNTDDGSDLVWESDSGDSSAGGLEDLGPIELEEEATASDSEKVIDSYEEYLEEADSEQNEPEGIEADPETSDNPDLETADEGEESETAGMYYGEPEEMLAEREKIIQSELMRLFVSPLVKKFVDENKGRFDPTAEELSIQTAEFRARSQKSSEQNKARIAEIERELAALGSADKEKRERLIRKKKFLESTHVPAGSDQMEERLARGLIAVWKTQIGLYEKYGGGRILWQQSGYEAFDALRCFVEEQQKLGNLKISDPELQQKLMGYWNDPGHANFLRDDPETTRAFLNPSWKQR